MKNQKESMKKWVKYRCFKCGAEFYELSPRVFGKLVIEAGALILVNRVAYVDCEAFEEYLLQLSAG